MRSRVLGFWLCFVPSVFLAGCGGDGSKEVVAAVTQPPQAACPAVSAEPSGGVNPDALADAAYMKWLKSDYVQDLDPKNLPTVDMQADAPVGPRTFDEAVDRADLVVAGRVAELTFIPFGTLTRFVIDRTAKGERTGNILVLQKGHIYPNPDLPHKGDVPPAQLQYDGTTSFLFEKDRAVLLLVKQNGLGTRLQRQFVGDSLNCESIYFAQRASGQYRSTDGRVKAEKIKDGGPRRKYEEVDGISETTLMDMAEARAKQKR